MFLIVTINHHCPGIAFNFKERFNITDIFIYIYIYIYIYTYIDLHILYIHTVDKQFE